MPYIYDGLLTSHQIESVKTLGSKYGSAVELISLPNDWSDWSRAALKEYRYEDEEKCKRATQMYGLMHTNSSVLIFFLAPEDKEKCLRTFPDLVKNPNPFKTIIE